MQERHKNRKLYFHELAQTSQKYFIPYIKQFKQLGQDSRILEIGCGDGGNLLPFAQMGYYTLGVDISERRIAVLYRLQCERRLPCIGCILTWRTVWHVRRHHLPWCDWAHRWKKAFSFVTATVPRKEWHCLYVVSCMADAFWWTSADMQKQGHKPFTVCPSLAQSIVPSASESMCRGWWQH